MVHLVINDAVMPKEAEVAVMKADFVDKPFAKEIGFIFGEMHVVIVAERAIHDRQRVKG